jgi:hypothetical protein
MMPVLGGEELIGHLRAAPHNGSDSDRGGFWECGRSPDPQSLRSGLSGGCQAFRGGQS